MPTFVGLCGVESSTGALRARELQSLHFEDVTVRAVYETNVATGTSNTGYGIAINVVFDVYM